MEKTTKFALLVALAISSLIASVMIMAIKDAPMRHPVHLAAPR